MSILSQPWIRLLAGLGFFAIFALAYFRFSGGRGKIIFALLSLVLLILFVVSPWIQVLAFILLIIFLTYSLLRKPQAPKPYQPAEALVESGGLKRGLTPAEAAVLIEKPLNQIMTIVLLGLQRKGVLIGSQAEPVILTISETFRLVEAHPDPRAREGRRRQIGSEQGVVLYPYEEPFLVQLEANPDLPLSDVNFTAAMRVLLRHVARRVRGHDLDATKIYYQQHLGRARHDFQVADEDEGVQRALRRHFEWLLLEDESQQLLQVDPGELFGDVLRAEAASQSSWASLSSWIDQITDALANSIPPGGVTVRSADGSQLAIGGRDPVSEEFFQAIIDDIK